MRPPLRFYTSRMLLLCGLMRIVIRTDFAAASFGDGFRSRIIVSPPLDNFRDPDSRFALLVSHRSVSPRRTRALLAISFYRFCEDYGWDKSC